MEKQDEEFDQLTSPKQQVEKNPTEMFILRRLRRRNIPSLLPKGSSSRSPRPGDDGGGKGGKVSSSVCS